MRSLVLLAASVALSGCLGFGTSESTSEPEAEARTAKAEASPEQTGNAADATASQTTWTPPVKPASVKRTATKTKAPEASAAKASVSKASAPKASAAKASASKTAASKTAGRNPMDDRRCYTVDLFTDVKVVKPPEDLPERYTQYLGQWGYGAWDGKWCHDLLVYQVYPDGQVALVDMHAPYKPWNQPASAFRRFGWIDKNGKLHFNYGGEKATYEIVDGTMKGTRLINGVGRVAIEMQRRAKQPQWTEKSQVQLAATAPKDKPTATD